MEIRANQIISSLTLFLLLLLTTNNYLFKKFKKDCEKKLSCRYLKYRYCRYFA